MLEVVELVVYCYVVVVECSEFCVVCGVFYCVVCVIIGIYVEFVGFCCFVVDGCGDVGGGVVVVLLVYVVW